MDKYFKPILILFCILWLSKEIILPATVAVVTYYPYMDLVKKCDSAMNSSWFINQTNDTRLEKTELIQMLDCHDYDKLRKIILISGLSENYLSYLGLKALELNQQSADRLVEQHRFIER